MTLCQVAELVLIAVGVGVGVYGLLTVITGGKR